MSDDKQFDADIDVNAAYALALADHGVMPARPCPSPGMLQVGKIEFGPGKSPNLTSAPKDVKVGLFVPIPDLNLAAEMLDFLRTAALHYSDMDLKWTRDEIKRVANSLKGQR